MIKLIDLGWCIGRLDTDGHKLVIVSPSEELDDRYTPSESVIVYGPTPLLALRDALNEAYPPGQP